MDISYNNTYNNKKLKKGKNKMSEEFKIEIFCRNCKKRIKVEYNDINIDYNCFAIKKICEHCSYKIDFLLNQEKIMYLINRNRK